MPTETGGTGWSDQLHPSMQRAARAGDYARNEKRRQALFLPPRAVVRALGRDAAPIWQIIHDLRLLTQVYLNIPILSRTL